MHDHAAGWLGQDQAVAVTQRGRQERAQPFQRASEVERAWLARLVAAKREQLLDDATTHLCGLLDALARLADLRR